MEIRFTGEEKSKDHEWQQMGIPQADWRKQQGFESRLSIMDTVLEIGLRYGIDGMQEVLESLGVAEEQDVLHALAALGIDL